MGNFQSITPVSPHEISWSAKFTSWFPDDSETEYQFFVRDGDYWREVIHFLESEIESVLATGVFEKYPGTITRLKAIAALATNNELEVCNA